nr:putative periplasmic protein [Salmonella sp. NCTC 7297]
MNQAIQFPDREEWEYCRQRYHLSRPGQWDATHVCNKKRCTGISLWWRKQRRQWLAIFREYRWDLEEEAEALILAQQEDDHGWIWLS